MRIRVCEFATTRAKDQLKVFHAILNRMVWDVPAIPIRYAEPAWCRYSNSMALVWDLVPR